MSVAAKRLARALLIATLMGCGGDGNQIVDPSVAATLAANSATSLTGVVGSVVTPAPSVIVTDENGSPVGGVPVTFQVVSGGGSLSGATVTTDDAGIATVGSWTLGTITGENVLKATSGTLAEIAFTAIAAAGAAASVARNAGDNQSAAAGSAVPVPPSVIVKDAYGNAKPDVTVTFQVSAGGGSVTGATAVTNGSGVAAVGSWTLGSAGPNSLSATAAGLPPVTFTASATSNVCAAGATHMLGTVSSGTLSSGDCRFSDGSYIDFYAVSIPSEGAYFFRQTASFDTYLLMLTSPDGTSIAENDDELGAGTNSGFKALLPPGNYLLGANSLLPDVRGDYTIASAAAPNDVRDCELVFVARNITTAQNIASTDCNVADAGAPPAYADTYFIFLAEGTSVTITMESSAFDTYLQLLRLDEQGAVLVAANDNVDSSGNSRIIFTATRTSYYAIRARSLPAATVGAYALSIR